MSEIIWGYKGKPSKLMFGHSAIQTGYVLGRFSETVATAVRCECGSVHRGKGTTGGLNAWERHVQRERAKLQK